MTWINVKVTWEETWLREYVTEIDECDLRDWAEIPEGSIPDEMVRDYLDAQEDDSYWHPGTLVSESDEFLCLDVTKASLQDKEAES